jgi:uncharacterized membrane protein
MFNSTSILIFFAALLFAVIGLMVGLDEPQNTPLELVSDFLKHGAVLLLFVSPLPQAMRMVA